MPRWQRNVLVLCFSQVCSTVAFSAYMSFIPYYVQEMGVETFGEAAAWQAFFESGSAVTMMLFSPLWGNLADIHGRKLMYVRATLAASILAFFMGLAQAPWQLVAIRLAQGALCGTVSAANTLVATETPDEHLGKTLGAMQTTQYFGHALGPIIGGILADALGYRAVFPISSALMFIAFASVMLFVHEGKDAPRRKVAHARLKAKGSRLSTVLTRDNAVLLAALGANSFALRVLSPIMALYIQSLSPGNERLATLAGTVISASAITSSISAIALGRLGDKIGQKRVLLICSIGATLIFVPQALATSAAQLLIFRAIQGVFMGGILPTTNALLARSTTAEWRGTIFGLATSASAGGRAVGPLAGAGVANMWGLSAPFWVTGAVYAIITVLVGAMVRVHPAPIPAEERALARMGEKTPCQND